MVGFKLNVAQAVNTDREERAPRREVDYDALNAHIIAAAGTATKPRSIPGVISGIIDLGVQKRPPFEGPWNEKDAAKPGAEEFLDGKVRMIRVPLKDVQQLAITADFPQIVVDKGQFFGDPSPLPLRLLLNSEFGVREDGKWVPIVDRGYIISEIPHDDARKQWGFSKLNGLHKLADAAGILDENGLFTKERVGELLGKVVQFQFRVYMKPGKDAKSFLTEEIKLQGMVPEGVTVPTFDESILYGVNVNSPNDPAALKQLRRAIKNTIKRATNYQGSVIQTELEALESAYTGRAAGGATTPPATPSVARTEAPTLSVGTSKGVDFKTLRSVPDVPKSTLAPLPEAKGGTWEDDELDAVPF